MTSKHKKRITENKATFIWHGETYDKWITGHKYKYLYTNSKHFCKDVLTGINVSFAFDGPDKKYEIVEEAPYEMYDTLEQILLDR